MLLRLIYFLFWALALKDIFIIFIDFQMILYGAYIIDRQ